ncbi:hypothetical protein, partial [Pseudoxanthomonas jiangsuensis]|uniref:hypothetical protein n=1 Tax=Pseudoxanthomonas jiangsuensis TaxID=619688 RepID=UPI003CCE2358
MTPDIILQRTGIDVRAVEQGDDAWHKLRLGVITASEVHNVIAKPRSGKKWPDMKKSYFHTRLLYPSAPFFYPSSVDLAV